MRQVEVTRVYECNEASDATYLVNEGGARSTKSHSIAQLFIQRFWNERNKKLLVSRKTGPALHITAYALVIRLLKEYGFYQYCDHDKTYKTITNRFNGSSFVFLSIDDAEKIKSTEWNYIWMEEATEFTWSDFVVCQTRLSGPTEKGQRNKIILSFNPTDENGWIQQRLVLGPTFVGKVEVIHSTWRDNPFLSQEYIDILLSLKDQDPAAFDVFSEGKYAVLKHIIYAPYQLLSEFPEVDETIYGLDFGFNNPSALLEIGIKDKQNGYLRQLLYQTGLTNQDLIAKLKEIIPEEKRRTPIYADCAEPARIEEISKAGFNIHPADKEVKVGIDFCKRFKFYTLAENTDLNKERSSYKWKQDKNGNILDEPVKFMDHLMDTKRYGLYTHHKGRLNRPGLFVHADDDAEDDY